MPNYFDKEYYFDYLKWMQFISSFPPSLYLSEILKNKNPLLAYFFALEKNNSLPKMQEIILNSKNPKYIFLFAQTICSADVRALQNAIIATNNIKYISKFALFVDKSNFEILEKIILKSKKAKYISMLLASNKWKNINLYSNIFLSIKKPKYLFQLAKIVSNKKIISQIEDEIIKSGSCFYIRMFALKIRDAKLEKLERAILDSGNIKEIKKFAKDIKNSKISQFLLVN